MVKMVIRNTEHSMQLFVQSVVKLENGLLVMEYTIMNHGQVVSYKGIR